MGCYINDWHHYVAILHNMQELLREGNACAGYLEKIEASSLEAYQSFFAPPARINNLLLADSSGIFFPR